jgi:energy-converting hydrogenase Eha subunit E
MTSLNGVTARSRNASFGAAAALVVAGALCAALFDGTAAGVVSILLIGVGLVLAVSLVFFAIGLSEDRERAKEERRR